MDEMYLRWLYSLVADPDNGDKRQSYWNLLRQMFTTEFWWLVPNDDNRMQDGCALRQEFIDELGIEDVDPDWINMGCSVLELAIGLARRLEFEADGQPHYWFWELMENIGVRRFHDGVVRYPTEHVEEVLHGIIFRQYSYHGHGGFFPLRGPCNDQRKVELWYQLSAYVLERA